MSIHPGPGNGAFISTFLLLYLTLRSWNHLRLSGGAFTAAGFVWSYFYGYEVQSENWPDPQLEELNKKNNSYFNREVTQVTDGVCVWVSTASSPFTFSPHRIQSSVSHVDIKKTLKNRFYVWMRNFGSRDFCKGDAGDLVDPAERRGTDWTVGGHGNGSLWTDWWLIITARHLNVLSDVTLRMNVGNHQCLFHQRRLKGLQKVAAASNYLVSTLSPIKQP